MHISNLVANCYIRMLYLYSNRPKDRVLELRSIDGQEPFLAYNLCVCVKRVVIIIKRLIESKTAAKSNQLMVLFYSDDLYIFMFICFSFFMDSLIILRLHGSFAFEERAPLQLFHYRFPCRTWTDNVQFPNRSFALSLCELCTMNLD